MPRKPQVHFRLKPVPTGKKNTTSNKKRKCSIFLDFAYERNRLFYSFGQSINPNDWNSNKERVKKNDATTSDGKHSLNDLLDNLEKLCEKSYNEELKNGIPGSETLKRYLDDFIHHNTGSQPADDGFYKLIDRFISGEIKFKGKDKSSNTLETYHAVKQHMKAYELKYKTKITFAGITLDFFYSYVSFLKTLKNQKKEPISPNTVAKDIRVLKAFMSEAVDLGLTSNLQFKHKKFYFSEVETDAVYLSDKELMDLYSFDFSANKKLEQVRDLFVFGSYVGLRFSDYSTIKPANIVKIDNDNFIKLKTTKTGEHVIIPCNHIVLDIFKKYESNANRLPKSLSNQKFNDYIKEVAITAGLTEIGRLTTTPEKRLHECISSHTARRSFATNLYLDGYPTIEIMKITGHKTEKSFMKYIRVTKLDAAKRLSAYMKKRWSEKMLRVAS